MPIGLLGDNEQSILMQNRLIIVRYASLQYKRNSIHVQYMLKSVTGLPCTQSTFKPKFYSHWRKLKRLRMESKAQQWPLCYHLFLPYGAFTWTKIRPKQSESGFFNIFTRQASVWMRSLDYLRMNRTLAPTYSHHSFSHSSSFTSIHCINRL